MSTPYLMQISGPLIETKRLILRPPIAEDFDPWAKSMADEEVMRFIGGVKSRPLAWRAIATMCGGWVLRGFGMFSVLEKEGRSWIGNTGPWMPEGWPGTEIGWVYARSAWGKGYATEAASAAIDWAFDELGWSNIIHCIRPDNVNSSAVARRLGSSRLRSQMLPVPLDEIRHDIYGQSREQWNARRSVSAVEA